MRAQKVRGLLIKSMNILLCHSRESGNPVIPPGFWTPAGVGGRSRMIWFPAIFLDSPSASLRVVSLSNHGSRPTPIGPVPVKTGIRGRLEGLAPNESSVELRDSLSGPASLLGFLIFRDVVFLGNA
jgi:hypothetical protein